VEVQSGRCRLRPIRLNVFRTRVTAMRGAHKGELQPLVSLKEEEQKYLFHRKAGWKGTLLGRDNCDSASLQRRLLKRTFQQSESRDRILLGRVFLPGGSPKEPAGSSVPSLRACRSPPATRGSCRPAPRNSARHPHVDRAPATRMAVRRIWVGVRASSAASGGRRESCTRQTRGAYAPYPPASPLRVLAPARGAARTDILWTPPARHQLHTLIQRGVHASKWNAWRVEPIRMHQARCLVFFDAKQMRVSPGHVLFCRAHCRRSRSNGSWNATKKRRCL